MEMRRGTHLCNVCYRLSPLGWVYICTEDTDVAKEWLCNKEALRTDQRDNKAELECPGFSQSEANEAANDVCTSEQVDKLDAQRRQLHDINTSSAPGKENISKPCQVNLAVASAVQLHSLSANSPTNLLDHSKCESKSKQSPPSSATKRCTFQCCHNCRPNSVDRTFTSFEAVFNGEYMPITKWDPAAFPVHEANLVRNIGLRPSRPSIGLESLTEDSGRDSDNSEEAELYWDDRGWLRRSREEHERIKRLSGDKDQHSTEARTPGLEMKRLLRREGNVHEGEQETSDQKHMEDIPLYTEDRQRSLNAALIRMDSMLQWLQDKSAPGAPTTTVATAGRYNSHDEDAEEADLGPCKTLSGRTLDVATNTTMPRSPRLDPSVDDESVSKDVDGKVEGGVALTEEAAETCTADLITSL